MAAVLAGFVGLAHASTRAGSHFGGGIGLALFTAPAYPGSDSAGFFVYPYPYWNYESSVLHLHHQHLRAKLGLKSRLSVGFGVNGSPPTPAGSPDARSGMDILEPTFALGPNVIYHLPGRLWGLKSFLSVQTRYRAALGTGLQVTGVGTSASAFWSLETAMRGPWSAGASIGPVWRSHGVNRYFFGVPASNAAPGRPAYDPPGGYAGVRVSASVTVRSGNMNVSVFGRYRNYDGAVFRASPLLKATNTFVFGVAVVWIFVHSHG